MQTTQTAINATTGASVQVLPSANNRRFMAIQVYSVSAGSAWVAFGKAATAGTAGELEIPKGGMQIFSESTTTLPPYDSVNVIGEGGTVTGMVMVMVA